jgi:hypothetical protein
MVSVEEGVKIKEKKRICFEACVLPKIRKIAVIFVIKCSLKDTP